MPELTLIQMNDVHGYLEPHQEMFWEPRGVQYRMAGGYARIASILMDARRERPERVMVMDGGDTLHGTYPVVRSKGEAILPVLNRLGIDAMTAHWEFAYGPDKMAERAAALEYPLLASNIRREEEGERPYPATMVKELDGLRVGVIGLACPIVDNRMPPHFSTGLQFGTGREELPELVSQLRDDHRVDLVVLLSHAGFPQDMQLVAEVYGIDVCLSSHTHNRLDTPAVVNGTLVIQSGSHGSFVGRLDLEVEHGKVIDYRHRLITVNQSIPEDREIAAMIEEIMRPHRQMLDEVVGRTETDLNRATSLESTMDNVLLDAMLQSTGAEIAFANGWRYGVPIPQGEITMGDLWNIVPMNPPILTVDLRGDEIIEMLEENLERTYARDPFDQMGGYVKRMAGANAYIRPENPRGYRVQRLLVGDQPVEPGRTYHATFVTAQGIGPKYGQNRQDTGVKAVEALRAYIAANNPVASTLRGSFVAV